MRKVHHIISDNDMATDHGRVPNPCGVGVHALIELYDCPYRLLNDEQYIRDALRRAAAQAQTHMLKLSSHQFSPQGVTALGLLSESHISIHTWPEKGYAAADLFTCSQKTLSEAVTETLVTLFQAGRYSASYVSRGEDPVGSVNSAGPAPKARAV